MVLKNWFEGLLFIGFFLVIVGVPCFFVAFLGSKMVNDLGNFPTKSAQIQMSASWKVLLAEIFSFFLLVVFFLIFT